MAHSSDLFAKSKPLARLTKAAHDRIHQAVASPPEPDVVAADADEWAQRLAASERLDPPVALIDDAVYEDKGPVMVDCTGMAGVSYSLSEHQPYMRDGRRIEVRIPIGGQAALITYSTARTLADMGGELHGTEVVGHLDWPLVKGHSVDAEINQYLQRLRNMTELVAGEVQRFNDGLIRLARDAITSRQERIKQHADFLSRLKIPVKPREEAAQAFTAPPIKHRSRPAINTAPPKVPYTAPQLGEFYEHILKNIRSMGVTMEQAPGAYAGKDEETLRDHLLLILNNQYEGQVFAEAFNKHGKTDLLIKVAGQVLFVAECKWWGGARGMGKALEQLYGYSTWRDSRLALILFVPNKDFTAVAAKAGEVLEARSEFVAWEAPTDLPAEMRCRIRWPDDPGREATLTVQLFHLER